MFTIQSNLRQVFEPSVCLVLFKPYKLIVIRLASPESVELYKLLYLVHVRLKTRYIDNWTKELVKQNPT